MNKSKFESIREKLEPVLISDAFIWLSFVIACIVTTFRIEVAGLVIFTLLISFILVFCEDIIATLAPFLLLCVSLIKCHDSYDTFIKMWWIAIPAFPSLVFHFQYYKHKYIKSDLLKPMIAVSVAVTLGGLFEISAKEYFSLVSVFYTLGLGFGMLLFYMLMNDNILLRKNYSLSEKITKIFIIMGLFCCFMIIEHYLFNLDKVLETHKNLEFQWRNNVSTFLLFSIPFVFLHSYKGNHAWIWAGFLFYGCVLLTGSRGGMVTGTAEVIVSMIALLYLDKRHRKYNIIIIFAGIGICLFFFWDIIYFFRGMLMRLLNYDEYKIRVGLFARAIEDFKSNPLFGRGLAYFGNRDLHHSVKFALCWYHSSPFQIIGSFGLLGVAAYLYQFVERIRFYLKRQTVTNAFILIIYLSLEMMSLVNPGLFSPPYLMIMMILFVVMDRMNDDENANRIEKIKAKRKKEKLEKKEFKKSKV